MPFKSKKQREYLKINHPDVYNEWKHKYGTKIDSDEKKTKKRKKAGK